MKTTLYFHRRNLNYCTYNETKAVCVDYWKLAGRGRGFAYKVKDITEKHKSVCGSNSAVTLVSAISEIIIDGLKCRCGYPLEKKVVTNRSTYLWITSGDIECAVCSEKSMVRRREYLKNYAQKQKAVALTSVAKDLPDMTLISPQVEPEMPPTPVSVQPLSEEQQRLSEYLTECITRVKGGGANEST